MANKFKDANVPVVHGNKKETSSSVIDELKPQAPTKSYAEDLLASIEPENKEKKGKTCSFYLDDDVVKALDRVSKAKGVNKSKLLNTILKTVLIGE